MTCIAGIVASNGVVIIGGDSAGVGGLSLSVRKDSKVFLNGVVAFGCTSSFRMIQLLQFELTVPPFDEGIEVYKWTVTKLIPQIRKVLKDGGFASKDKETESGGTFLVGVRGRLFTVYDDYQVAESMFCFETVGCGHDLARGALAQMISQIQGDKPAPTEAHEMVEHSIEIAQAFCAGVQIGRAHV